ncbi:hypothetical protein tinsulaeT_23280 [Thalassotalea insulae]|uniref:DUF4382 domain-containing protein n=1 Tax=Thalassotalea insulae TaxID=2056778 RepID=A0ABQ6GSU3_9GAMM|nr:DUF4382 domain-containing protein [Thalassotalea insulae]GLX78988.1 hypothetical protein tinsulaeT_23280 [Thalassotalea insulae]
MKIPYKVGVLSGLIISLISCGGGSSSSDSNTVPNTPSEPQPASLTLGISDAPVDDAAAVVITIDSVTFKMEDGDDVTFDTFSNEAEGIEDAETVQIDLLQYTGASQFNILEGATIAAGDYNQVFVSVLTDDIDATYLEEKDGDIKPIKLPSEQLKLGGITLADGDDNANVTIEFNLRKSMTYNPGPDRYILKPTGVRVVDNAESGSISGTIDLDAINQLGVDCVADSNMIYLYQGNELDSSLLADNFNSEEANNGAPEGAIAPFDSTAPSFDEETQQYNYEFGFVPAGDYTLAYACNLGEEGDDAEMYDGIAIANPEEQMATVSVAAEQQATQDFPIAQ